MTKAANPRLAPTTPPDNVVLAQRYQFLSLLAQGLDMGVGRCNVGLGGDVAFQQPHMLAHHGFGLGLWHAGCHQFLDIRVGVEDQRRLYHRPTINLLHSVWELARNGPCCPALESEVYRLLAVIIRCALRGLNSC